MMNKRLAVLAICSVGVFPLLGSASPAPSDAPQASPAAAAVVESSPAMTAPTSTPPTGAAGKNVQELNPIVVTVPKPYIWTYEKGASKVLVLGTVSPEPEGLSFVPVSISRAIAQSGAVVGTPSFYFDAQVGVFSVLPLWHAVSSAKYLPDGKHLSDVLSTTDLQLWNAMKATYLGSSDKFDSMRPMYAGWQLYDAVLKHSGVAVKASIPELIKSEAEKHGVQVVDAQFHWIVKDAKNAAHAFEPSQEADLSCFEDILHGINGVPDSARTLASAWAVGDVATMQTYLNSHALTRPCWGTITQEAVAEQQGLNRDLEVRKAWLAAFNTAASKYPVVFTTAPVQDIFKPARQIEWLMQEGYVLVPPDGSPSAASTPAPTTNVADAPAHDAK